MLIGAAVATVVGYLLGSVLPADILARSRGVDIRSVGTRNPGTSNAFRQLGLWPGLVTGVYDASVGLVAMWFASRLGLPAGWQYAAGLSAIVGHIFPIWFGFRGGQGMAASVGLLIYGIGVALARGMLSVAGIALLAVVAVVVFALTLSASVVGVFAVPVLAAEILLARPDWQFAAFMSLLSLWIWLVQVDLVRQRRVLRLAEPVRARLGRLRVPLR